MYFLFGIYLQEARYKCRMPLSKLLGFVGVFLIRKLFRSLYIKNSVSVYDYYQNKIFPLFSLYTGHQTIQNSRIYLSKFDNVFLNY